MTTQELLPKIKKYTELNDYSIIYRNPIRQYLVYFDEKGWNVNQATFEQISEFIIQLKTKLKNGTINNYIAAIKFLYQCLNDFGYLGGSESLQASERLKFLPIESRIKPIFTIKEVEKIIEMGINHGSCNMGVYRIRAIIYFMLFTGVRRKELINLKRQDIDIKELCAIIRIPTKNRNERVVFFPKKVALMLEQYFAVEEEYENAFNLSHAKLMHFFDYLKNFQPKDKNLTAHSLRHTFTQMLCQRHIDIRVAQKLLGHKSIRSTMIYFDPDVETVQKVYRDKIR